MSELKCPFCQQELRSVIQQEGENTHTTWYCPKCELGKYKWACGNKTLWQALIDTRKALDVAVDALKWIDETYNLGMGYEAAIMEKCEIALEQIIALEQKE